MEKEKISKIYALTVIFALIANMVIFAMGKIDEFYFWIVLILGFLALLIFKKLFPKNPTKPDRTKKGRR